MTAAMLEPMVIWLAVGLVTGLLASFMFVGYSVWRYLAAGVAGAVIVSYFVVLSGVSIPISDWVWRNVAIAAIGAFPVIVMARIFE